MHRALPALFAATALATASCARAPAQTTPVEATADAPLSDADARQSALALADVLEEAYVFPDTARRYADALRSHAASGAYDGIGSVDALAAQLTADLREVSPDNHLRVRSASTPAAARRTASLPTPIEEARWLAPGVAYIRFTLFPSDPATVAAAEAFLVDHADADTIIFDIRGHHGGGLAVMDALFPYLYGQPTTLVGMDTRASVGEPDDTPTLRRVPTTEDVVRREHFVTPHPSDDRLFETPVYVLTSRFTASAAEHFALSLKRTGRATLVGEATAGAGHYGGLRTIGDTLGVFVPVGRTFDPDTGDGWEGVGITPHVPVPAEQALVEALTRSGVPREEAERLSADVRLPSREG